MDQKEIAGIAAIARDRRDQKTKLPADERGSEQQELTARG
jgi:hypothetical protein